MNQADATKATIQGPSDDDLLGSAGRGDTAAFAVLLERHGGRVAGLARAMLAGHASAADVDDVVQETFLRLWVRAPQWRPRQAGTIGDQAGSPAGAKISTWLHRVAANLCIDRLRKRTTVPLDAVADPQDTDPPVDARLEAASAGAHVARAVAKLPPRQCLAITLCHMQELSNIEAAAIMEISIEALESLLGRGRRALRGALETDRSWLLTVLAKAGVKEG
ncbi:MAG: sigma-70 family RNA polymerase sigma factor [Alphaproteobacteria bacterium]